MQIFSSAPRRLQNSQLTPALACFILLFLAAGCGGDDLASVKGLVKLDGRPLKGGSVTFNPQARGPLAYSNVAPDGSYELQSASARGVKPGAYLATVSYRRGRPSANMTVSQIEALELVPVRYTSTDATTLHFDVTSGENRIDLELFTKP